MAKRFNTNPILVFATRHGSLYNLTASNLHRIPGIQLSAGDFYDHKETLRNRPQGLTFKQFLGLSADTLTYLSPYDFYKKQCMLPSLSNNMVKIKTKSGYTPYDSNDYDEIAELINPDILVTLTQYPSRMFQQSGREASIKKAHKKTISYLQKSKFVRKNGDKPLLLGPLHISKEQSRNHQSIQELSSYKIDGLVICGLCEDQDIHHRQAVFRLIKQKLNDKAKFDFRLSLAGQGKLEDIQHGLQFGISIFQVNYPFLMAQQHLALIRTQQGKYIERNPQISVSLKTLDPFCSCYTCSRHSESYIAYLIQCQELNAKVLLSIHNVQVYLDFLKQFD